MDQKPPRTPRKSLTRSQLEAAEAVELLGLLQTITADGRLLDEEIKALRDWLSQNANSELPAVIHLRDAVETALADGRVSDEERTWLHETVETVLPREERSVAAMRRREAKADERAAAAQAKLDARELAQKSKPLTRFDFMVAGVLHEGRAEVVRKYCREDDAVFLVREPSNRHSRNAILLRLQSGHDIGYVPESDAVRLAPLLDGGALQSASVKKVLHGRQAPVPVVWGELFAADAPVQHAVKKSDLPRAVVSHRSGCLSLLVLIAAAGVLGLLA